MIGENEMSEALNLGQVIGSYGNCDQCNSVKINQVSNNHSTATDPQYYLENWECEDCGYGWVD